MTRNYALYCKFKRSGQKLPALSRIPYLLDADKLKLIMKAFISYPSSTSVLMFQRSAIEH